MHATHHTFAVTPELYDALVVGDRARGTANPIPTASALAVLVSCTPFTPALRRVTCHNTVAFLNASRYLVFLPGLAFPLHTVLKMGCMVTTGDNCAQLSTVG